MIFNTQGLSLRVHVTKGERFLQSLLLFSLLLAGNLSCGSSSSAIRDIHYSASLIRRGGFSGMAERYTFFGADSLVHTTQMPGGPIETAGQLTIARSTADSLYDFIRHNFEELSQLHVQENGELTSGVDLKLGSRQISLFWPNLDPPLGVSPKLDTLNGLMSQAIRSTMLKHQ